MLNGWCAIAYVDNASSWPQSLLLNVCTRWSDGTPSVALLALIVHANPDYCKCTQLHAMIGSRSRFIKICPRSHTLINPEVDPSSNVTEFDI